jgi:hypothetical protein
MGVTKSSELVIEGADIDALGYGDTGVTCGGGGAGFGLTSYESEAHPPRPPAPLMPGSMLITSNLDCCGRNSSA